MIVAGKYIQWKLMWHPEKKTTHYWALQDKVEQPHFLTRHVEQCDVTSKRYAPKQSRRCTNKYFQYSKDVSRIVAGPSAPGMQRMTNNVPIETCKVRGFKSRFCAGSAARRVKNRLLQKRQRETKFIKSCVTNWGQIQDCVKWRGGMKAEKKFLLQQCPWPNPNMN